MVNHVTFTIPYLNVQDTALPGTTVSVIVGFATVVTSTRYLVNKNGRKSVDEEPNPVFLQY